MTAAGLSQQAGEAEGSLNREVTGRAGAALTTPGRAGTARRSGSGKQDGKVYECRNQWWNPLKSRTGSNLADMGRAAVHVHQLVGDFVVALIGVGAKAALKVCGVGAARLQGKSWAPPPSIGAW
jgi:hypothetical protein